MPPCFLHEMMTAIFIKLKRSAWRGKRGQGNDLHRILKGKRNVLRTPRTKWEWNKSEGFPDRNPIAARQHLKFQYWKPVNLIGYPLETQGLVGDGTNDLAGGFHHLIPFPSPAFP